MTALTVTPGSVTAVAGAITEQGRAGATITAGQVVYKDSSQLYQLADADSATAAAREGWGIALNGAAANQPLTVLRSGDINIGATVTVGEIYVLDTTAGGVAPEGDLASGEYVVVIGVGITTGRLRVAFINSGVAVPA